MVLVVEKKFLEEDWWLYPLGLFLLEMFFWVMLGYRLNPTYTFVAAIRTSYFVYGSFLAMAYLPFIAGRLQYKTLFWFGLVGFFLGSGAYYTLSLMKVGEQFNLLPIIAFLQIYVTCFSIGLLIEFGRYVLRKLAE